MFSMILKVGWHFMFSKFLDFFDTVFFVLRKKQSQVSFLHVYHHANMALVVWAYIKYSRGSYGPLVTILNTFIHAVMYGYYLLAALGPQVQKNLWWKQHLTRIQLAQFIIVMSYLLGLLIFNCELSKAEATFMFLDCSSFFFLFLNFYRKAYLKSAKNIATPSPPVHVQPLDENKMK
nr:PREDICTED: elongation of very long chain fatty acids protein AAEL008004-like [Bemisia tabaci]